MDELRRREGTTCRDNLDAFERWRPVELPIVTADDGHRPPDVFLSHGEREREGGEGNGIVRHLASIVVPAVINTCDVVTDHFDGRYFSC